MLFWMAPIGPHTVAVQKSTAPMVYECAPKMPVWVQGSIKYTQAKIDTTELKSTVDITFALQASPILFAASGYAT